MTLQVHTSTRLFNNSGEETRKLHKLRDETESSRCHCPSCEDKQVRTVGLGIARDSPQSIPLLDPSIPLLASDPSWSSHHIEVGEVSNFSPPDSRQLQAAEVRYSGTRGSYTNFIKDKKDNGYYPVGPKSKHMNNATKIDGVLLGYKDKHAIYGIWRNKTLRLQVVPHTRDGNYIDYSPLGLEAYHVNFDTCVFETYLKGLTRTEIEEYCRICTEYNAVGRAIEEAKRRVTENAKAAGLNTIKFDEMRCIRRANQGQYQRTRWLRATAAKKNIKGRPGNKEAQHTAAVNSIVVSETAETMCQNVDDMPSTPLRDIILRKRTYSQQASSDGDILQQTSDFEPNEESEDDIFERASCFEPSNFEPGEKSDQDVTASENTNEHQAVRSRQGPSQNANPSSANTIVVETAGHRHSKRTLLVTPILMGA
ncbi:hypothetical protein VE03_10246, partial [Pseudogymnoascus sp. 23342-1-I1]